MEVIVISAIKELDAAIEAMRHGAYHYISKDFDLEGMRTLVANASERQDLNRHLIRLRAEVAEQVDREFVVGPSRATRDVIETARKVARLSATVLILGESGTGKELLARMIHRESGTSETPFVAVNLAAIPKELVESTLFGHEKGAFTGAIRQHLGKFELASGGTLFLDEIGDLRYELQAKLLRAIPGGRDRAGWRNASHQDRIPTDCGHQHRPGECRQRGHVSRGLVLPAECHSLADAAAPRPHRGPPRPGSVPSTAVQRKVPEERSGNRRFHAAHPERLLVARQHPRAGKPHRAPGGHLRQGMDH